MSSRLVGIPIASLLYDAVIIGGGVVGWSVARSLRHRWGPSARILVVEKESRVGMHGSGRNSGILHAGFYYSADSLKARFCREGNRAWKTFLDEHRVPFEETGKVVIARNEEDVQQLHVLYERGKRNRVEVELIDSKQLSELEPMARSEFPALWSPSTASVSPSLCMKVLERVSRDIDKIDVVFESEFVRRGTGSLAVSSRGTDIVLRSTKSRDETIISCGLFVNCAGLFADKIAHAFNVAENFTILPFKGLFLSYDPHHDSSKFSLQRQVYPVPNLENPFLGTHFTRTFDGKIKIGPTAIPAFWREQYQGFERFSMRDFLHIGRMMSKLLVSGSAFNFRRLALQEFPKYLPTVLLRDAESLLSLPLDKRLWKWYPTGIRAQLFDTSNASLVSDFLVRTGEVNDVHVLNAVSPGWTCAFPFAKTGYSTRLSLFLLLGNLRSETLTEAKYSVNNNRKFSEYFFFVR